MTLICDAGAFVALEREDRRFWRRFRAELAAGQLPLTHGGVIGQVWRGGSGRQVHLARALRLVQVQPLTNELGRVAGLLLGASGQVDAIDAAVVALAHGGDVIATSDPLDIARLIDATGRRIGVLEI